MFRRFIPSVGLKVQHICIISTVKFIHSYVTYVCMFGMFSTFVRWERWVRSYIEFICMLGIFASSVRSYVGYVHRLGSFVHWVHSYVRAYIRYVWYIQSLA